MTFDTVSKLIYKGLELKKMFKPAVHLLQHIVEKKKFRKLYKMHLHAEKWKFVITLDEAMIYLSDCNRKR